MAEKKQISILEIQNMLKEGKDRKEIARHFGMSMSKMQSVFKHEKLKGLKVVRNRADDIEIIDDAPERKVKSVVAKNEAIAETEQPSVATVATPSEPVAEQSDEPVKDTQKEEASIEDVW